MINPDRWLVLTARVPSEEARPLLAEGLLALGGAAVQEEGDVLVTYLLPPDDPEAFLAEARGHFAEWLPGGVVPELSWRWQENEDWARKWREGLGPRKVTDRLVVKPTWTEWERSEGEVVIDIDPQMAFGTGEHATTRGCLRLLDDALRPGDRVVDIGSGSAILAIAAALLGASQVVAVEYDPDANLNARENLEQNGVEERVRIVEAMADPALLRELGRFDLVLANILSSVIRPLLPAFREALGGSSGGRLIVSGILGAEHAEVVREAAAAGFRVERADEEEEWWSALLIPARERP
ncbi:MAG: 50S ribosomal protein L11 methyltransferase [Gemmatimonadota bacterium]|nr:50S ribosomal protein L11 methyltransferase [Gemmatimonadota bacterium]